MKKLNLGEFKKMNPCKEGYEFVLQLKTLNLRIIFDALEKHNLDWASWLIARLLRRKDQVRYAIFAAEQVINIFEARYPEDKRPRKAIEAAKAVLKSDTAKNRKAAYAAYAAASAAANAAYVATYAAANYAAAYAAYAAANAAAYAAYAAANAAANATAYAAYAAANAAANAAAYAAAKAALKLKVVEYGVGLLIGI